MKKSFLEKIQHNTYTRPFSIHYTDVEQTADPALYLHCHPEMELFYLEDGEVIFHVEDMAFHIKKGQAIFVPPGLLHYAEKLHNNDTLHISFHAIVFSRDMLLIDDLPPYCEQYFTSVFIKPSECILIFYENELWQKRIIELIKDIISFSDSPIRKCELAIRGNLFIIWQNMYNNHFNSVQKTVPLSKGYEMLVKSLDYIKEHYSENITLSELSDIASMSEGHFCRSFKQLTGFSPFNYINRLRISKSLELLTDTNKKISEIALLCGYNNISYFNRTFYKTMHESPSDYRKNFF